VTPFKSVLALPVDLMRHVDCGYSPGADDEIVFRKLQKEKLPGLTDEQFQTLFAEWCEHYQAKCALDWQDAIASVARFAKQEARQNPPASRMFVCRCGAETTSPLDPVFWAVHKPHFDFRPYRAKTS
jgi:hypothetical protein